LMGVLFDAPGLSDILANCSGKTSTATAAMITINNCGDDVAVPC
jgi:hypothetical protein